MNSFCFSQSIFKEEIGPCLTERFVLDKDTVQAELENDKLLKIICDNLKPKLLEKLKGKMYLQVIVYNSGNSCLMSVFNNTNFTTNELNIKEIVNDKIKWETLEDKSVCAIIFLSFDKKFRTIKRYGYFYGKGYVEINSYTENK
ncbi:MAG: hypothetical protein ABI549_00195 [Flavobacterium sp.]|uniref:hypothetical protein n=1 Tax=Flavobacterium sp. TaxID=239 RepID=UPI003267D6EB